MQKQPQFASPQAYLASLDGWRLKRVKSLRSSALAEGKLEEAVKWGHLVYASNGPVLLIRAEANRVLFGFWRGQRLRDIEPALKGGGKYEMATLEILEDTAVDIGTVRRLVRAAVALNEELGDPTVIAKSGALRARQAAPGKRKTTRSRRPAKKA